MGAREFGRLVERHMHARNWTQAMLAYKLSRPERQQIWNETQVRRLRLGEKRLDHDLVQRVVEALELTGADADEAWHAAGFWPPSLTMDELQRLHAKATEPTPEPEPEIPASAPAASGQSGTQRKGSPTRQPAPVAAVAA